LYTYHSLARNSVSRTSSASRLHASSASMDISPFTLVNIHRRATPEYYPGRSVFCILSTSFVLYRVGSEWRVTVLESLRPGRLPGSRRHQCSDVLSLQLARRPFLFGGTVIFCTGVVSFSSHRGADVRNVALLQTTFRQQLVRCDLLDVERYHRCLAGTSTQAKFTCLAAWFILGVQCGQPAP